MPLISSPPGISSHFRTDSPAAFFPHRSESGFLSPLGAGRIVSDRYARRLFLSLPRLENLPTAGLPAKQAETEAYLGLVEIGRENYSAAAEYLAAAATICRKSALHKTAADIANWQGLACYLQKDMEKARTFFAATLSSPSAAPEARAFAAEMLARLSLQQKDYPAALRRADEALSCHQKNRHRPGIFENLYLKAEIYYAAADYEQSAAVLTALIKEKSPPSSTYYPANAYTLLGLIYSETGRINLARTLFKQALDLESSLNRIKGAAVDYNNLAELSLREGHKEEAEKYLRRALEYAETLADKELINYLKSKL